MIFEKFLQVVAEEVVPAAETDDNTDADKVCMGEGGVCERAWCVCTRGLCCMCVWEPVASAAETAGNKNAAKVCM